MTCLWGPWILLPGVPSALSSLWEVCAEDIWGLRTGEIESKRYELVTTYADRYSGPSLLVLNVLSSVFSLRNGDPNIIEMRARRTSPW